MFLSPIFPEISLFCSAIFILLLDIFFGKKSPEFFRLTYVVALLSCIGALYPIALNTTQSGTFFHDMFFTNSFTAMVKFIAIILLVFVIILSLGFLEKNKSVSAEFLALLIISTVGGMFLISANDFLTFYLALELQALPLYLLASINRKSPKSSESGMKYFILGSVASGLLLLGISTFYGFSGTTNFSAAIELYRSNPVPPAVVLGFVLIIIAMFFKISAAPFHMWTPDVYEGANSSVTTFFATVVKFLAALVLVRLFLDLSSGWVGIDKVLIFTAIASIAVGSFGAIRQNNLKRLLAYSGIGNIGFFILALAALNLEGIKACILYMIIYATISLGTFGFLNVITGAKNKSAPNDDLDVSDEQDEKIYDISSLSGLSKTNPLMALTLAVLMFSIAGIPPLAGFFSKFYVILAILKSGHVASAVLAILFSVVSAYYYLRIVKVMYFDAPNENQLAFTDRLSAKAVIAFVALFNLLAVVFLSDLVTMISVMLGF